MATAAEVPRQNFEPSQVRAVFLLNFCRFVVWPNNAFESSSSPLTITVWGDPELAELLGAATKGERIGEHPVTVRSLSVRDAGSTSHVLFISPAVETKFAEEPKPPPVGCLIVGNSANVLTAGGHIQFVQNGNRLRFRVALESMRRAGLTPSSNMLKLAEIVPGL